MIDEFYDQIVIKTEYKNIYGSGVLLQPENNSNSYLLTAWHCINNDVIKTADLNLLKVFRQINGEMLPLAIVTQDILIVSENDLVIIRLEHIAEIPICRTIDVTVGDQVTITGFPIAMNSTKSRIKRYPLDAKVASLPGKNIIMINSEQTIETNSQSAINTVSNFSGSGIFKKVEDDIFLCGLITELSSPEGAFGALSGALKDCIQERFQKSGWDPLPDISIDSFVLVQKNVIELHQKGLK